MAKVKHRLADCIVKDHFGDLVCQVSSYLIKEGCRGLRDICTFVNVGKNEVKKSLSILIQHQLVKPELNAKKRWEYRVLLDNILRCKMFPKYVYCAKVKFGDVAELIVETLLLNGSDSIGRLVKKVAERLEGDESGGTDESVVIQKFVEMINSHFLKRLPDPSLVDQGAIDLDIKKEFLVPVGIGTKRKASGSSEGPSAKKVKNESDAPESANSDDDVFWHVNFAKFDIVFMDQMIIDAVAEQIDQSASKIVSTILRLTDADRAVGAACTKSVSFYDIIKKLPSAPRLEQSEVNQYLTLLCDKKTGGFVTKTDDSAGGMYCVDVENSMEGICHSACSQVVQERCGSKACRVFRLLYLKKHLEQKQVGEMAMIPFKEVKELLYKLFEERLVKIQEISKTSDYAPSRTFYLFSVDMPDVARLLMNRCYQALGNLMTRRESQMAEHKRLLEKNEKLEGILAALGGSSEENEQVIQELEELITPTEKQQLEKLKIDLARLEQGEIQVQTTVHILQSYLMYH